MNFWRSLSAIAAISLIASAFPLWAQSDADNVGQKGLPAEPLIDAVGAGGEFTYSFPIDLPDFRGLEPALGLSYNSANIARGGVENFVAFGWRLSGLSRIERHTVAGAVPTFDDGQDVYALDGAELMVCRDAAATNPWPATSFYPLRYLTDTPSASCSAGGNMSTRVESYNKILYTLATNEFLVTRPNGQRYRYQSVQAIDPSPIGGSADAQNIAQKSRWLLTEITDTQKNSAGSYANKVTISYTRGAEADGYPDLPSAISYGGYTVQFGYTQPTVKSANFGTGTDTLGIQRGRLASVAIYDGGVMIRAYGLVRTSSALTGTPLLSTVQTFGSDTVVSNGSVTGGTQLPPVTFDYSNDTYTLTSKSYPGVPFHRNNLIADWDYDGRDQILMQGVSFQYYYSSSSGSQNSGWLDWPPALSSARYSIDPSLNLTTKPPITKFCRTNTDGAFGDNGFLDPIRHLTNNRGPSPHICIEDGIHHWQTGPQGDRTDHYDHTYSTFAMGTTVPSPPAIGSVTLTDTSANGTFPIRFGNFDRDPEQELIVSSNPTNMYDLTDGVIGTPVAVSSTFGAEYNFVSDFTGDGVDDFLEQGFIRSMLYEDGYLAGTLRSRGYPRSKSLVSGHYPASFNSWNSNSQRTFIGYGDVNGDGLGDLIEYDPRGNATDAIYVYYSTGFGFTVETSFQIENLLQQLGYGAFSSPVTLRPQVRDVNADGLVDIVLHSGFRPMPQSGSPSPPYGGYYGYSDRTYIVLNTGSGFSRQSVLGAGSFDGLVGTGDFDGNGLDDFLIEGANGTILFNQGQPPNRMTAVHDAKGGSLDISYLPSSRFGTSKMPMVQQVVSSLAASDGRGSSRTTTFTYVGANYDFLNRTALGFKTVSAQLEPIAVETNGPSVVITYLNGNIAVKGLVKRRITSTDGTTTWSQQDNEWDVAYAGNGPYRAEQIESRTNTRFGGTLLGKSTLTDFNLYGQPASISELGFTNGTTNLKLTDDATTVYGYDPNLAAYIVDRPKSKKLISGADPADPAAIILRSELYRYDGQSTHAIQPIEGNLTELRVSAAPGAASYRLDKVLTYDDWGNVLTEQDARATVTTHTYDVASHLFRTSSTTPVDVDTTVIASAVWNRACQKPTSQVDPNGLVSTIIYDKFCRETTLTKPNGQVVNTTYLYNAVVSNPPVPDPSYQGIERRSTSSSVIAAQNVTIQRDYVDGLGQTWKTAASGTNSAVEDTGIVTVRSFDQRGNIAWESIPLTWTESLAAVSATKRTGFAYDSINRPTVTTFADGTTRSTEYTKQAFSQFGEVSISYPAVRSLDAHCYDLGTEATLCGDVTKVFDHGNRPIRELRVVSANAAEIGGAASTTPSDDTQFQYDLLGQLTSVVDPGGATWVYEYDVFGDRVRAHDPDLSHEEVATNAGYWWTMAYDANHNLTLQTDAKGQQIAFTYDKLNRFTQKVVTGGSNGTQTTALTYDEPRSTFFNVGQVTTRTLGTHTILSDYDNAGLVAKEQQTIGTVTYAQNFTYTPTGALKEQKLPASPGGASIRLVWAYEYDAANRLTKLTNSAWSSYAAGTGLPITEVSNVIYDIWGNASEVSFGNGLRDVGTFDAKRGWPNNLKTVTATDVLRSRNIYTRTATGRVREVDTGFVVSGTTYDPAGAYAYGYDYAGRLLSATSTRSQPVNQTFTYDSAGRMRYNSPVGTYQYHTAGPDHAPWRIQKPDSSFLPFTFDANGNMLTGLDGQVMTYDGENRPLSVTRLAKVTCYTYGADGSRLRKIENVSVVAVPCSNATGVSPQVATVYFGSVEIRNFGQGAAEVFLSYPHPNVRQTTTKSGTVVSTAVSYLHRDQLGSVRLVSDNTGQRVEADVYRPFGEQQEAPTATPPESKGFIGERFDADGGLQYLNARYYDPKLGLFLQPDWFEVTEAGVGTNRYGYAGNDPVNGSDPGGHNCFLSGMFGSSFCDRSAEYSVISREINGNSLDPSTRSYYFDAVSSMTRNLGSLQMPGGQGIAGVDDDVLKALDKLSNGIMIFNREQVERINSGEITEFGADLDSRLISDEQKYIESRLESMKESEPNLYHRMIESLNENANMIGTLDIVNTIADPNIARAADLARTELGHNINFVSLSDRTVMGKVMVRVERQRFEFLIQISPLGGMP